MTSIEWERRKSPAFSARGREVSARHPHPALGRRSVRKAVTQDATAPGRSGQHPCIQHRQRLGDIKRKQCDDVSVDPRELRRALLDNGYEELAITSLHAFAVEDLPPLHNDPFDRMLVAQSRVEGITLLTRDAQLLRYHGLVQKA